MKLLEENKGTLEDLDMSRDAFYIRPQNADNKNKKTSVVNLTRSKISLGTAERNMILI